MEGLVEQGLRPLCTLASTPRATLHLCRDTTAAKRTAVDADFGRGAADDTVVVVKAIQRAKVRDPKRVMIERDALRRVSPPPDAAPADAATAAAASPFVMRLLRTAKNEQCLYFVLEVAGCLDVYIYYTCDRLT